MAQNELHVEADAWGSVSSNDKLRPLLSYSNEWGRFTQYDESEVGVGAAVNFTHIFKNPKLQFAAGVSGQMSKDSDRRMVREAYADWDLWMFDVKLGLQNYSPVLTNNSLSVGSYIMSNNASAIPRGWVGILDYWPIPMPKFVVAWGENKRADFSHLMEIRGGISLGWLGNEDNANYTDDILFHEKFVALRIGLWKVKPYFGLFHSCMMGGTLPSGEEMSIDFWSSFFGKSGDASEFSGSTRGEQTNAAGAHQGLWDMGWDFEFEKFDAKFYYQRPFTDNNSMTIFRHGLYDLNAGFQVKLNNSKHIKSFVLEYSSTEYQGDPGIPDPVVPTQSGSKRMLFPDEWQTDDIPYLKENVLLADDVEAWESEHGEITTHHQLRQFFEATYNNGYSYGGRESYLTNGLYKQGWTHKDLSMGNPLMHTDKTVKTYAPEGTMNYSSRFSNMRVRAINVGVEGTAWKFDFIVRLTVSKNYGNYQEEYEQDGNINSTYSWKKKENYYFEKSKWESYTKVDVCYHLTQKFSVNGNFTYDCGDLYHSFATRVGVKFKI